MGRGLGKPALTFGGTLGCVSVATGLISDARTRARERALPTWLNGTEVCASDLVLHLAERACTSSKEILPTTGLGYMSAA